MTDLTPARLAALDQAHAQAEAELDDRVAELRAAIDGLGPHEATALLQTEYARMPADTARLVLAMFMARIIKLTNELEADRVGWEQDRAELAGVKGLLAEARSVGKTLAEMTAEVRANNIEKGWRTGDNTFGDYIALLHSELSEALEAYRDRRLEPYTTPAGKPDDVGSEMADVLIRLLDTCDVYGIDLAAEYERKTAFNRTRPYQHGGRTLAGELAARD